ncbi:MAG: T9SS type A sorting domain-containing protein [Hyphomicrobiales bacterium]
MKKLLLTGGLILGLGLSGIAQNTLDLAPTSKEAVKPTKVQGLSKSLEINKVRGENAKETAIVPLWQFPSLYVIGNRHVPANYLSYEPTSKVLSFSSSSYEDEATGSEKGFSIYNFSKDMGATWNDNFLKAYHPYYDDATQINAEAHYNLSFLLNQTKSTNPDDVNFSYYAMTYMDWDDLSKRKFVYNTLGLGTEADKGDYKDDSNNSDISIYNVNESCQTEDNIFIVDSQTVLEEDEDKVKWVIVKNEIILVKGTVENNEVTYKRIKINTPDYIDDQYGEIDMINHPQIAFNDDASLGYLSFNVLFKTDNPNLPTDSHIFILKTEDKGETWTTSDHFDININSPGMKALADFWTPWWDNVEDPAPVDKRIYIIPYHSTHDLDLAIDKDNNPILVFNILPKVEAGWYSTSMYPFFFHKVNDVWTGEKFNTYTRYVEYAAEGETKKYVMCHRLKFVSSPDRKINYIFYADSDEPEHLGNTNPNIYYAAYEDGKLVQPDVPVYEGERTESNRTNFNLTRKSDANEVCFWPTFATEMVQDPDDKEKYRVHATIITQEENLAFDWKQTITFNYIKNLRVPKKPGAILDGVDEIDPIFASVSQNVPNPFNGITRVNVELVEAADLKLDVYNVSGQKLMTINKGESFAGNHTFEIDGSGLDAGVYFYSVVAGESVVTKKMIIE